MNSERGLKGIEKVLIVAVAIVAILIAAVGVYYLTRPGGEQMATEQTLVVGDVDDVYGLDPVNGVLSPDLLILQSVFDRLVKLKTPDCNQFEPMLATSWTVSDGSKTYEFTLRNDVKYHDGTGFTANDVKYSVERAINLTGMMADAFITPNLDRIEVLDTYRIRFRLKTGDSSFLYKLNIGLLGTYSEDIIEAAGDSWGKETLIGTGPYKFVEYIEGERVVLERNDNYWGSKPILKKIVILIHMDETVAKLALERGDIDVFLKQPLSVDVPALKANPDLGYASFAAGRMRFIDIRMNRTWEGVSYMDKRIRQAICYAINVTRLWEVAYKKDGEIIYSLMNPVITPYYKPVFEKYKCDPDKAKALMAEAGYPNGFKTALLYSDHFEASDIDAAQIIKDDLAKVGIDCALEFAEWAVFRQKAATYPLLMDGWSPDYLDPENLLMDTFHGVYGWLKTGIFPFNNSRYNEIGYLARQTTDIAARKVLYDEAQEILAEECIEYPFRAQSRNVFYRTWVKNLTMYPTWLADDIAFSGIYIAEH